LKTEGKKKKLLIFYFYFFKILFSSFPFALVRSFQDVNRLCQPERLARKNLWQGLFSANSDFFARLQKLT
jgi:hypothetical protein